MSSWSNCMVISW